MLNSKSPPPDPRVKRTRQLLEDAFQSLMAERPCDEISVGDVTRRAMVNRATFYAHFDNFRHFAIEMLRGELETALRNGVSLGTPLNSETLIEFGTALFEFMDKFYRHCSTVDSDKELNISRTFQETIHLGQGLTKPPPDPIAADLGESLPEACGRFHRLMSFGPRPTRQGTD